MVDLIEVISHQRHETSLLVLLSLTYWHRLDTLPKVESQVSHNAIAHVSHKKVDSVSSDVLE